MNAGNASETRGERVRVAPYRTATLLFLLTLLAAPAVTGTDLMPPPDFPLLEAVKKGDVAGVKSALETAENLARIDERGSYGQTPLAAAARNGSLEIVRLLSDHGAQVDGTTGHDGRTPLMEASACGHAEVVRYLISKGADVNARRKGLTPLLAACEPHAAIFGPEGDKKKTALVLLENGADVNVQDESWIQSGATPLMLAVARGDPELVQAILDRGARLDTKNGKGGTALSLAKEQGLEYIASMLEGAAGGSAGARAQAKALPTPLIDAIREGSLEKVKTLVAKGADVNSRTRSGSTALMFAAESNRPAIAAFLLDKGADANAKNGENNTALIYAAAKGNVGVARVLLKHGADANVKNIGGGTALICAVVEKRVEMAALLVDNGSEVNGKYDDGKTALVMAVEKGDTKMARLLLDRGADANIPDEAQKSALLYACEKGDLKTVRALVSKGADVDAASKYGDTALSVSIAGKHEDAARFLIDHGADLKAAGALSAAIGSGSLPLVKLLVAKGADVNRRDPGGMTPVMHAAKGDPATVKFLIEKGAGIDAKDNGGRTALMEAVESFSERRMQTIGVLLESGANVDAAGNKGETALILAARKHDARAVRVLLEKGSAVNAADRQGKTAWTYAVEGGCASVMELLEKKGALRVLNGATWEGNVSEQKEEFIKVVPDGKEWTELWARAFGKKAPDVDFERYAVACVFLGHSASWLYGIEFGTPWVRDQQLVIAYSLIEVQLRLSGPFKAGGQYRMTVYERARGLEMVLEGLPDRNGRPF